MASSPLYTTDQIIQQMIAFIQARQPNIATQIGSVVNDVVISAPAQQFESIYTELARVSDIQSLSNNSEMTTAELDAFGSNYDLTRNPGTQAQSNVTFRVVNLQITQPNINIPIGTIVTTQQTANAPIISFATTIGGTFISSQASSYFNPLTGFYELTLPVLAQSIGSNGNVNAGSINVLSSSIPNIFSVTNTVAATGGTDQESNAAFAARIQLALSGNNLGTINGIESLILVNQNVLAVSVVGPNDPEMLRNEFGGSIDVYVLGDVTVSTTEVHTFNTLASFTFIFANQPATVTSGSVTITGIVNGSPYIFAQNTDYILIQDPTTLLNGSVDVMNGIQFLTTGQLPDNLSQFTILYSFNQLIPTLQNTISADTGHVVGADILVKEANATVITVQANIAIISGYTASDVISNAQTAVTNFLVTNTLGASFSQSQIVAVIEDTPGVDEVDLTSLVITKDGVTITTQTVSVDKTQYISLQSVNLGLVS
jgi:uncharacterized phage protein gp47/JayE